MQVDYCESDVVRTQEVGILAVAADEQGTPLYQALALRMSFHSQL